MINSKLDQDFLTGIVYNEHFGEPPWRIKGFKTALRIIKNKIKQEEWYEYFDWVIVHCTGRPFVSITDFAKRSFLEAFKIRNKPRPWHSNKQRESAVALSY